MLAINLISDTFVFCNNSKSLNYIIGINCIIAEMYAAEQITK